MAVRLVVDMNLSPDWVRILERNGWSAVHWSSIGDKGASDETVMNWADTHGYVVFTHDLDFGTMLALSRAHGPSVLQVRAPDVLPKHLQGYVIAALRNHDADLSDGALVVVEAARSRVRILPI